LNGENNTNSRRQIRDEQMETHTYKTIDSLQLFFVKKLTDILTDYF